MFRSLLGNGTDSPRSPLSREGSLVREKHRLSSSGDLPRIHTPRASSSGLMHGDEGPKDRKRAASRLRAITSSPIFVGVLLLLVMVMGSYIALNKTYTCEEQSAEVEKLSNSIKTQSFEFGHLESKLNQMTQDKAALEQSKVALEAQLQAAQGAEQGTESQTHEQMNQLRKANSQLQKLLQAKVAQLKNLEAQVVAFERQMKQLVAALHKLEGAQGIHTPTAASSQQHGGHPAHGHKQ